MCFFGSLNLCCKKSGFSLIELLISLITISCLLAAFVPVITKKISRGSFSFSNEKADSGILIYNNPGSYVYIVPDKVSKIFISAAGGGGGGAGATSVSKNVVFDSPATSTWTVPAGVNEVELDITGAGGGGGAANAKEGVDVEAGASSNLKLKLKHNSCNSDEFLAIRGAESGQDLCITKNELTFDNITNNGLPLYNPSKTLSLGETCNAAVDRCCWKGQAIDCSADSSGARTGCNRPVCNFVAAEEICKYFNTLRYAIGPNAYYRLLKDSELTKIKLASKEWGFDRGAEGLNLCTHTVDSAPYCYASWSCFGAFENRCNFTSIVGQNSYLWFQSKSLMAIYTLPSGYTGTVRCVRELKRFSGRYNGSGGNSGAKLVQKLRVLPEDVLEITIGKGGFGGFYNVKKNNGIEELEGNGTQGETTKVIHKRQGVVIGEYYVKGGFGGYGATNSADGKFVSAGVAAGNTTPSGTCYANGDIGCSVLSYSGAESKTVTNGGAVANPNGDNPNGGYFCTDSTRNPNTRATDMEIQCAKGRSATISGWGGGGGFTPLWAYDSSNFYNGGEGAAGKVVITYNVILPGGGGGAAGSAGKNTEGENSEFTYNVTSGQKIVFTVGKGGSGGSASQSGSDGGATVFGKNEIVFEGGKGGKISSESQTALLQGGLGGAGGYLKVGSENKNKGSDGLSGQVSENSKFLNYGFDGGLGGATFLGYKGACGGGIIKESDITLKCNTANSENGLDAESYNPVDDTMGGSGGGGGGATLNSGPGKGGSGACGFVKIRY